MKSELRVQLRDKDSVVTMVTAVVLSVIVCGFCAVVTWRWCMLRGMNWCTIILLLGCIVYFVMTFQFVREAIRILQWCGEKIIVQPDALYVKRANRVIRKICWDEIQEVGLTSNKKYRGGHMYEMVYFSTQRFVYPPFIHTGDRARIEKVQTMICYYSKDLGHLQGVLPGFDAWLACVTDPERLGEFRCSRSASCVYAQKNDRGMSDGIRFMTCAQYEKLCYAERKHAMLVAFQRILYTAVSMSMGILMAFLLDAM